MAKDFEMGYLLDFYGEVLTPKQREMLRQYYNDDLSLSEIGENFGITRQGARDAIKHGETALRELEEKVGFAARYRRVQQTLEELEQLVIEDNPIDEDYNGFDELGIADVDSDATFVVGTVPAFSNAMLRVDTTLHRLTAVIAPNEVAEQADGIIFFFAGFALPSCFQADCRFIHIFVYDGIILFCSCISGVIDDSCNTGFVPYGSLLRIGDLAVGQLVRNCLQGSSVQIRIENLSDNFRFFS